MRVEVWSHTHDESPVWVTRYGAWFAIDDVASGSPLMVGARSDERMTVVNAIAAAAVERAAATSH